MLPTNTAFNYKPGTYDYQRAQQRDSANVQWNMQRSRDQFFLHASTDQIIEYAQQESDTCVKMLAIFPTIANVVGTVLSTAMSAGCAGPACMVGVSTLMVLGNCCCLKSSVENSSISSERRNAISYVHLASAGINSCMWIVNVVALSVLAGMHKC